nr:hypothetical protein CFP56_38738 [Quercus suber]
MGPEDRSIHETIGYCSMFLSVLSALGLQRETPLGLIRLFATSRLQFTEDELLRGGLLYFKQYRNMQSLLQYRRLRADVEEDLSRLGNARGSTSSITSFGTQPPEKAQDDDAPESGVNDAVCPRLLHDAPRVPGVTVSYPDGADGDIVFLVGWRERDPSNPKDWSMTKKWLAIITTCVLTAVLIIPTSVEGPTQEAFNAFFGINGLAGSMTTGGRRG